MLKFRNIFEQEDKSPDQVDRNALAKELHQKLYKLFYGFSGRLKYTFPDGSRGDVDLNINENPADRDLSLGITYRPNLGHPNIPQDYLKVPVSKVASHLKDKIFNKKTYPREILEEYRIKIGNEVTYYSEGIVRILDREYLPAVERNSLLLPISLYDLIYNTDQILDNYVIPNPPKFSPDYALAMDKAVKKLKTIYMALRKGTFKGRSYELPKDIPTVIVHQSLKSYNKEDRIIHPDFSLSITTAYPTIDGTKETWRRINSEEDTAYLVNLDNYLKKKFENFGISYR